jgi:hypothetical protein
MTGLLAQRFEGLRLGPTVSVCRGIGVDPSGKLFVNERRTFSERGD